MIQKKEKERIKKRRNKKENDKEENELENKWKVRCSVYTEKKN